MIKLVIPQFYLDIAEEVEWLACHATPEIAEKWAQADWETLDKLDQSPRLGRTRADLPFPGIRSWRVKGFPRWMVFHGIRESELVLYRVRHGAMNLMALDYS